MDGHMDSFGTQQQQRSSGSVRVLLLAWANSTRLPTTQSTVYYRRVHNPLMFHYWFPCMLRLYVTPLPKMNSELTSHDPWYCCLFLACVMYYQVCVMCYVLRGAVVIHAWCVVVRFHALLRPLNCGP